MKQLSGEKKKYKNNKYRHCLLSSAFWMVRYRREGRAVFSNKRKCIIMFL